jgi:hypothetical protein
VWDSIYPFHRVELLRRDQMACAMMEPASGSVSNKRTVTAEEAKARSAG